MSETTAALHIDDFVRGLVQLPTDDRFVEACTHYLQSTQLDSESLAPYAHFFPNRYTRNLVFRNDLFEVIALCWQPGQVSSVHNHRDQSCWVVMAQGQLESQNYRVFDQDPVAKTCRLEETDKLLLEEGGLLTVEEDEPVHQVRNLAEWDQQAISLHIYSKPIDTCEVYCPEKGVYGDVRLFYWSKYGTVVREQVEPCKE